MTTQTISSLLSLFFVIWLGALLVVVLTRMLTGDIAGLLSSGPAAETAAERAPVLLLTLVIAFSYVVQVIGTPLEAMRTDSGEFLMPDIPQEAILLLGGSHTAYITGKFFRLRNKWGRS